MSMLFDPMLKGTGASANLPVGQQGWLAFWRVGSGVATTNAFRWLQYSTG
jgi:predicted phage gp36 major capsid-like protein